MGKNARQTSRLNAKSTLKPSRSPREESLATTADVLGKKLLNFSEPSKTPEPGNAKVISVVNQKGVVKFFDGQTGKPASFDNFREFRLLITNGEGK